MRTLTKSAIQLKDNALRLLVENEKYAGMTETNIISLANRIAELEKSVNIKDYHVAEAITYGGNIHVFIGMELQDLLKYEQQGILLIGAIENYYKKRIHLLLRIKEVFGVDVLPLIFKKVKEINSGKYGKKYLTWYKSIIRLQVNYKIV